MNIEDALKLLSTDRIRNINLINFIKNYPIYSIDSEGSSLMVRGKSDRDWVYISSNCKEEFEVLIKKLNRSDQNFSIMEDWMIPYIIGGKGTEWVLSCMKLYLPDDTALPESTCIITELSPSDAVYIYDNYEYKEFVTIEYIEERLRNGIGLGIYEKDCLAAWIITQDDGAMGFLNVLPEFRRKGYGFELTLNLISRLRAIGEIPFVHIEEDNEKSMNLSLKLGFVKDRRIHWFKRNTLL